MADKFDPAPKDKHADDPKQAQKLTKKCTTSSTRAWKGRSPRLVSTVQPGKSKPDAQGE